MIEHDGCRLCGAEIGADVTGRPMCYGCGPADMLPKEIHGLDNPECWPAGDEDTGRLLPGVWSTCNCQVGRRAATKLRAALRGGA